jgi:hypothetical protein
VNPPVGLFVVLQQLEPSVWCVVRRSLVDGRPTFASRVATARPYNAACRIAVDTAKAENLHLGIQALQTKMRRFDPDYDMREPKP